MDMKKVKLICAIAVSLLLAALFLIGCTPTHFDEIFYCTSTASCHIRSFNGVVSLQDYGYKYYVAPVQKATRSHAEYRAVKVAEDNGKSVQYEIRDKYTNKLVMVIEYDANGKVLNFSQDSTQKGSGLTEKYTYEYNENGTLGKIQITFLKTGETYPWVKFEYDSNGRCIHSEQYGYSKTKEQRISNDMTYEYSNDGKTVKITEYNSINDANSDNPQKNSYMYEYDDDGKIVKRTILGNEEKETAYTLYEYKDSLLQKRTYYAADYNWLGDAYDDKGMCQDVYTLSRIVVKGKWSTSGWAGEAISFPIPEYDESGRISKTFLYHPAYVMDADPNAEPIVWFEFVYEYDSNDNTSKETVVQDGKTVLSVEYEYDKNGLCRKSIAYDGNNQVITENNGYIGIAGFYHSGDEYDYDFGLRLDLYEAEQGEWTDSLEYSVIHAELTPLQ